MLNHQEVILFLQFMLKLLKKMKPASSESLQVNSTLLTWLAQKDRAKHMQLARD